jgi:Bacterial Ig domain/Dockerin type I domain
VIPVNDRPSAGPDTFSVQAGQPLNVPAPGVVGNDTDIENDPLTAVIVAPPANGTLVLNANGGFVFSPSAGFTGTTFFDYTAFDGADTSDPARVTINVTPATLPLFIPPVTFAEGDGLSLRFIPIQVAPRNGPSALWISTTNGSATSPGDFLLLTPIIPLGAFARVAQAAILVRGDNRVEGAESFALQARLQQNGRTVATASGTVTLADDDVPGETLGDIDGDGDVDLADLAILLGAFGRRPGQPGYDERADLDGDGTVGPPDLAILLSNFGAR